MAGKTIPTLLAEMDTNRAELVALAEGLTRAQFNWSPEPGQWSIGQNLAHLNHSNGPDLASFRSAIDSGYEEGMVSNGPFHYAFLYRKFAASQEPPVTRKFKAPKYFQPPAEVEVDDVVGEYKRIATELRSLAERAEGLHLACVRVELSAFPLPLRLAFRMPLGSRFELLTAHDRRHLAQATEVRRSSRFPSV
jgi:hypothetical protein